MRTSGTLKKSFSLLLVLIMVFSMISAQAFAAENEDESIGLTWEQVDDLGLVKSLIASRKIEESENEDLYDEDDIVRVAIFLDGDSTIAAGYPAADIAFNKKAMSYRSKLEMTQQRMESTIASAINQKELDVIWNLTLAANVISANVRYGDIDKIKAVRGVKNVVLENQYAPCVIEEGDEPNMAIASDMVGSRAAWASGYTGAGSRVAIIDTGVDTDHQSFAASGFEYSLKMNAELLGKDYDEYVKSLDLLDASKIAAVLDKLNISFLSDNAEDYYVTSKIAFGANYVDSTFIIDHDHDSQGEHGSHVTGIAAANKYIPAGVDSDNNPKFNNALEAVRVEGNAPDAQIMTFKVFGAKGGAYDSDYMAAIEDAIVLGADSVNLSLGSAVAGFSFDPDYEDVMDAITESGTTVCISAGNNYEWAKYTNPKYLYKDGVNYMTSGSPGSYTNSFTVASVNNDGTNALYFKFNGEDRAFNYTVMNSRYANAFTTIAGDHEFLMLDPSLADLEADAFAALADELNGKVAMSWRGNNTVGAKANAAVENGAIGTILCNNQSGTYTASNTGYSYKLPVATITQVFGEYIMKKAQKHETADGLVYYTGPMYISATQGGVAYHSEYLTMSNFSSWGVTENLELVPEITAPGGTIYSVNGARAGGTSYENMSGTSMAAPQITGLTAVLGQYFRENGIEEKTGRTERQLVQSLLMSTAVPAKSSSSKYYYPVIEQGAGLARVDLAVGAHSYIWMDKNATASYADGKVKAELGDDPDRTGKYSFSFSINNMTDEARSYELSADMFTQAFRQSNYLDLLATPLTANVTWTVNGVVLDPEVIDELLNCDFDGDGNIDTDDGQALLDWIVGNRDEIFNMEYADLDADEDIDTYDAYLFFLGLNKGTVIVPGSESTEVKVDIELLNIADYDFNGAYVEGYVFAKELLSSDGVEGDEHSIPVLAYYGGWNEASMFDLGSYMDYQYKNETRRPYLYSYNGNNGNAFGITYAGEEDEYYFGGNPVVFDDEWLKDRDAINGNDAISSINFALVRNAAASRVYLKDSEGKDLISEDQGMLYAAYYYASAGGFQSTSYTVMPEFDLSNIAEGDRITIGFQATTGYKVEGEDGEIDWNKVGKGGTYEMSMRIDNTAPVVTNISYRETTTVPSDPNENEKFTKTINLTVQDNQYIAGVVVSDEKGNVLGYVGADPEQEEGAKFDVAVDVTKSNATKFLVEVSDYALNTTSYKINLDKEEARGELNVDVTPESAELIVGKKLKLTADVTPWGTADPSLTWTSSNEKVAVVDAKGVVTALSEGTAVITATSNADPTKFDTCEVKCIILNYTIYGELQDTDGTPMTYTWNMAEPGSKWQAVALPDNYIQAAANSTKEGMFYNLADGGTEIELVEFATGETKETYSTSVAYIEDIALSAAFEDDHIWGVGGTSSRSLYYLFKPVAVTAGFTSSSSGYISLQSMLRTTGATKLCGITSAGMVDENTERIVLLDNKGYVWLLNYNITTAAYTYEYFNTGLTGLGLTFPGYSNVLYCSLVMGDDGNLFLSYFNGDTNQIYVLSYAADSNSYKARLFGDIGYNVWPGVIVKVVTNAPVSEGDVVTGSLNSVEEPIENPEPEFPEEPTILSKVEASEDGTQVIVTLVAGNEEGAIDVTNGKVIVNYDPEILEYDHTDMNADYSSVNDKIDGSVIIGFADVDGIEAGLAVGKVVFNAKKCCDLTIEVIWDEENNDHEDLPDEFLELECWHANAELVGYVAPTCEDPGYSGDLICPDCDAIIEEGHVLDPLGHEYGEDGKCVRCGKERPNTGDSFSLIGWSVCFAFAAAGTFFMLKKRGYIG